MFNLLRFEDQLAVVTDKNEELTYHQLQKETQHFTNVISSRGLTFTLCDNNLASFVGYVGLINNNIPQVLLDSNKNIELLDCLIEIYKPKFIWTPEDKSDHFKEKFSSNSIYKFFGYTLLQTPFINNDLNNKLLLCLTTSGSTGSPKLVRLSKKNIESNAQSIAEYLSITNSERPVLSLPMHYSYGMSIINSHLIKGATILLTDKTIMQKEFWAFIKKNGATSFAGVPYTYEMLKRLNFFNMPLPHIKVLTQAGGKLNEKLVKEYAKFALSNNKQFFVMYGQTEASPRISYMTTDEAFTHPTSIGRAIPGGRMSLRNDTGEEIRMPGVNGELIYEGPNVCLGYANSLADLSKGDENDGLLYTGDIAHFDENDFFYITGRKARFVKIWGNRTNLDTIEQLVKSIDYNCACIGVDDKITVFITKEGYQQKVIDLLVYKTGFNQLAFNVRIIDNIPLKNTGKTDYIKLQELL